MAFPPASLGSLWTWTEGQGQAWSGTLRRELGPGHGVNRLGSFAQASLL